MDLALNNQQRLICHKTLTSKQTNNQTFLKLHLKILKYSSNLCLWYCYDFKMNEFFFFISCLQLTSKDLNLQVISEEVIQRGSNQRGKNLLNHLWDATTS